MLESRDWRGDIGVVGGRGGWTMNPPPLSRCGHKEGTLGSPAGRKAGRVGGVPLQSKGKNPVVTVGLAPLLVGGKTAPGSMGALSELAREVTMAYGDREGSSLDVSGAHYGKDS